MKRTLAIALILSLAIFAGVRTTSGQAAAPEVKDRVMQTWNAKNIPWERSDSDGTKWAVLEGNKDAPGESFTYAFFIPAGYWEHHWHTQDARVAVIQGALKVAQGDWLDKENAIAYPAGSYLFVPASVPHTMGADVDTIIIGTAKGPWRTHRHEEHMHQH